jgi:hypothetical protein
VCIIKKQYVYSDVNKQNVKYGAVVRVSEIRSFEGIVWTFPLEEFKEKRGLTCGVNHSGSEWRSCRAIVMDLIKVCASFTG